MTQENLKKLLTHLQETNQPDAAKDILVKYPNLAQPVEQTKSKGKK